ncbi:MAG: hybrid sensor histidine kinase/response regulator [Wenzhouxiangella sp.]
MNARLPHTAFPSAPECVRASLNSELERRLKPLVLQLRSRQRVQRLEGDPAVFGYQEMQLPELVEHLTNLVVGLEGQAEIELPLVTLPSGAVADIKWIEQDGRRYVVLLDVSDLHAGLLRRQQTANEIALLNEERLRHIEALESAQETLRLQTMKLSEVQQMQSNMLNGLVHDLGAPLTSIVGYLDLLALDALEGPQRQRAFQAIRGSADYISELRAHLLELASDQALNSTRVKPEAVDLKLLLARIEETFAPLAADKQLSLKLNLKGPDSELPWLDRSRLERICFNLVSNAIRYTRQGSVEVLIKLDPRRLQLSVRDTGVGIPESDRVRIFQPFGSATLTSRLGTGLGLYIVKQFTAAMDGHLALESTVGRGSCFTITLPVASPPEEAKAVDHEAAARRAMGNRTIAVVEDNEAVAELMELALSDAGFRPERIREPEHLVSWVSTHRPGGVLLDQHLIGRSGVGYVLELRLSGYNGLIIMSSGDQSADLAEASRRAGTDFFLPKPFSIASLQRLLQETLR